MHELWQGIAAGASPDFDALAEALVDSIGLVARFGATPQDADWHAEGDVRAHTQRVLAATTMHDLDGHPKVGASWEGFALGEVLVRLGARTEESFFWATHGGAELDLLVVRGRQRLGFECKRTDAPRLSPSIRSALADLKLDRVDVVHAGDHTFPLAERVRALSLSRLYEDLEPLR